ncbi:hypothetical protein Tco_0986493 [Tanacetum coccineum]
MHCDLRFSIGPSAKLWRPETPSRCWPQAGELLGICWRLRPTDLERDMGLFNFIKTADPRKVQTVEVQKGANQVKLLKSTEHCFMPLVSRDPGGSSLTAGAEVSAPVEERLEDVAVDDVAADEAYLELAEPGEGEEEVVAEQPKKTKRKRLVKQSDPLPAKKLRANHPSLASGTGGKTLAGLEQIMPADSHLLVQEQSATPSVAPPQESKGFVDLSAQASLQIRTTAGRYVYCNTPKNRVVAEMCPEGVTS